jgi:hypothetical protein
MSNFDASMTPSHILSALAVNIGTFDPHTLSLALVVSGVPFAL